MPYSKDTDLPSVTDILSPWVNSQWFTRESCLRGDQVHEKISSHLKGEFFIIDQDYDVYFQSFKKFENRIGEVVLVEERLIDEDLGYCGQPDLVFIDSGDGVLTLGDWKTAVAVQKYYILQLGGYSILLRSQKNINVGKNMLIRLRKELDKNPLINVYSVKECEDLFRKQLELYNFLKRRST